VIDIRIGSSGTGKEMTAAGASEPVEGAPLGHAADVNHTTPMALVAEIQLTGIESRQILHDVFSLVARSRDEVFRIVRQSNPVPHDECASIQRGHGT